MNLRTIVFEALTILSSFSTLICCALPAALVSIGAGAVLASVVTAVPQLVWLSEHKLQLFLLAGLTLTLSGILAYGIATRSVPLIPHKRSRVCACGGGGAHFLFLCNVIRHWLFLCLSALQNDLASDIPRCSQLTSGKFIVQR
jgi:hypothetical protein